MEVYAVGKIEIQSSQGDARLLLYGLYEKKEDAEKHRQCYMDTYYKERLHLCRVVVEKIKVNTTLPNGLKTHIPPEIPT